MAKKLRGVLVGCGGISDVHGQYQEPRDGLRRYRERGERQAGEGARLMNPGTGEGRTRWTAARRAWETQ
jgi:hypothetical protein